MGSAVGNSNALKGLNVKGSLGFSTKDLFSSAKLGTFSAGFAKQPSTLSALSGSADRLSTRIGVLGSNSLLTKSLPKSTVAKSNISDAKPGAKSIASTSSLLQMAKAALKSEKELDQWKGSPLLSQKKDLTANTPLIKRLPKMQEIQSKTAEPSIFANFLFKSFESLNVTNSNTPTLNILKHQLYYLENNVSKNEQKRFDFATPSPDDAVLKAQSQRGGAGTENCASNYYSS